MPKLSPDKKWARFNEDLQKYMKANDFYSLGTTYYEMAKFLEKEGKDNTEVRKLGYKMKLRVQNDSLKRYKESGVVSRVEIMSVPSSSCDACMKLHGKIISLNEALQNSPIPVEDCTYEYGCRCTYGPHVD